MEGGRRESPTRTSRTGGVMAVGNFPGSNVADERLFQQKDQATSEISGVFEGTAGTGGDSKFVPGSEEEGAGGESPSAYEFFRGKTFKAINFEGGFAVNRHLGRDVRSEFTDEAESPFDETLHLTRATTIKQLEAISKSRKRIDLETPVERITRLQREVTEMISFIQTFMESRQIVMPEEKAPAVGTFVGGRTGSILEVRLRDHALEEGRRFLGADPGSLLKELNILRNYLDAIMSSDTYKTLSSMSSVETTASLKTAVLPPQSSPITAASIDFVKSQLEAVEAIASEKKRGGKAEGESSPFTYELYMVPSANDSVDICRILQLEKRLGELEAQLGLNKASYHNVPFSDVSSALKKIVSRLSLLHPSRLDGLTKRFQTLSLQVDELVHRRERLDAVQQKPASVARDSAENLAEEQAVSNLYDFCESTRPAAASLPYIVRRLKALKILHQEAASLASRLDALETQQVDLAKLLDTTQQNFDSLRDGVQKNMLWAREVVQALEKR